jgi:pimeloyl-ACP methyl ester carboxylesterase
MTEALARFVVVTYLYSEPQRRELFEALALANDGNGDALARLFERAVEVNERGGITPETTGAIRCADRAGHWDAVTAVEVADFADTLAAQAPRMGPSFGPTAIEAADYNGDCAIQPLKRSRLPDTIDAARAGPILVIGATGDTATPYDAAVAATKDLDDARLVTVEADHHTSYFTAVDNANAPKYRCVLDAIHDYLIDLTVPVAGITCTD